MTQGKSTLARATTPEAKLEKLRDVGAKIAASLRSDPHMHQEHAAVLAGISRRAYFTYLDGEDEACLAFQALVLPAVYEQAEENRKKAEMDIACVEQGSGAWASWHKYMLEKRYRKIYGDLAQEVKVELTGPDGGPIRTQSIADMSVEQLTQLAALKDEEDA